MAIVNVQVESGALEKPFSYWCDQKVDIGQRVHVNLGHRKVVGMVVGFEKSYEGPLKKIVDVIDKQPIVNQEQLSLATWMASHYLCSLSNVFKTILPPVLKPTQQGGRVKQVDWLIQAKPENSKDTEFIKQLNLPLPLTQARRISRARVNRLLKEGVLKTIQKNAAEFLVENQTPVIPPPLTQDQQKAFQAIQQSSKRVSLLHGVTGSGKTEVFFSLAKEKLDQNKQVLFLVPEISLTPQMVERVRQRFGQHIVIYHSRLTRLEKQSQYELVKSGQAQIVVGTRSAVFLPFQNLGLILMDEEHEASYQQDNLCPYHTKDIAQWRADYHQCQLVLASATPSLDAYAKAYKGLYQLVRLPNRINQNKPTIQLVDMSQERVKDGLSESLIQALSNCLAHHQQAILLLNRRGYLPMLECEDCHHIETCPDCGLALSYHRQQNRMVCHVCGYQKRYQPYCPQCGHSHFFEKGMGTEKLEQIIQQRFTQARIIRMDADTTTKKGSHERLLTQFGQEGDILIGTQMVAKGLDFAKVSLVGILQADNGLYRANYLASERTYQLVEQAAGRSGRAEIAGQVLIQTYHPEHYVMQAVQSQDYERFFVQEMRFRHLAQYPPYQYLASFTLVGSAIQYVSEIQSLNLAQLRGPIELSMRQKKRRVRFVLKSKSLDQLINRLAELKKRFPVTNIQLDPQTWDD